MSTSSSNTHTILATAVRSWPDVAPVVAMPQTDEDLDRLLEMIKELVLIIGDDENHPLHPLLMLMSDHVEAYEKEHDPEW